MTSLLEVGLVNAVMATGLAMLVWLATRIWRHPAFVHTLWIVVLLKLITPPVVSVPWRFSEQDMASQSSDAILSDEAMFVGKRESPVSVTHTNDMSRIEQEPPQADAGRELGRNRHWLSAPMTWTTPAIVVWLSGTVAYLFLSIVRLGRFHKALSQTAPAPIELQQVAADVATRFGFTSRYHLRVTEGQLSPLVWPIGRPTILMPRQLFAELSPEEVETLLAHEFAHLCRRDHWLRWLELAVTAAYWWHPVVWWAKAAIGRAEEKACDAWVVSGFPDASARYASALFKAIQFASAQRQTAPAMASALGGQDLKERIEHIMNATWKPRLFLPVRLSVLVAAIVILPISLQAVGQQDTSTQPVGADTETADDESPMIDQGVTTTTEDVVDLSEPSESPLAESADAAPTDELNAINPADEFPAATTANPFAAQPAAEARPGMQPRRVSIPADPYHIAPGDVLFVAALAGGAGRPVIRSDFVVEPSGSVALGPQYGRVKISGLSLEDAEKAVTSHLKETLRDPMVQITIGGWRDRATTKQTGYPTNSPRERLAISDASSSRQELPRSPLGDTPPFPWETQRGQPQASTTPPSTTYRDLIPAASSPSITESISVLKKIVERSEQDFIRVKELAEKNAVSSTEVARAKSEYEISAARLQQGERALRYHRAVLAAEEAEYQMLVEASRRAPGSLSESELRRARLAVELAKAKLEELAE